MTKPSITTRADKGAALTYEELDQNFENLKDATLTLTAGSGGTAVTADLNGTITLVAGTNVTITGDNTAKTITIAASGGGAGSQTPWTSDIDTAGYKLVNNSGFGITIGENQITLGDGTATLARIRPQATNQGLSLYGGNNLSGPSITLLETVSGDILYQWSGVGTKGTFQFPNHLIGTAPLNTSTPIAWLKIKVEGMSGIVGYIPVYQ